MANLYTGPNGGFDLRRARFVQFNFGQERELQNEFESWWEKAKKLYRSQKTNVKKLITVGQIVGRLLGPDVGIETNPNKPPIEQKAAADLQKIQEDRRKRKMAQKQQQKPTSSGSKEVDTSVLGEIFHEYETTSFDPEYELTLLTSELNDLVIRAKKDYGIGSILAEILLDNLNDELKNTSRAWARRKHFGTNANPTGVEVHHWFPFQYISLIKNPAIKKKHKHYTIAVDRITHAYLGKAIDMYMKTAQNPDIEQFLSGLGKIVGDHVQLNSRYFVLKNRFHQNTSPTQNASVTFYGLKSIPEFREYVKKFGLNVTHLELDYQQ